MDFWTMAYTYWGATKDQLKKAVVLGGSKGLTVDEYKTITGEVYSA